MRDAGTAAPRRVRLLPLLLLLLLGCLWSLGPSASKYAMVHGVAPVGLVFWQTAIAGTVLLTICLVRRQPIRFEWRYMRYYLVMGGFGILAPNTNMAVVMRDLPAGLMAVIIIFAPVITYVVALAVRLERYVALRAAGVVLGFAGAAVLVLPRGSLPAPELLPVALLAFVTPTLWAVTNIFAETHRPADGKPYALAMGTMYAAAAGSLVGALATGDFHPLWDGFAAVDAVIVGYGVVSALTFTLFYTIVALAGAVYLAQVGFIVTLTGIGWGALFYGERPGLWLWAAMALIFAGVACVNIGKGKAPGSQAD
ncbi:MAG: DMT family transporter [Alphaproteobacteria bacterium]|jgi:drug/metabolite transporter (DMT)-like permease